MHAFVMVEHLVTHLKSNRLPIDLYHVLGFQIYCGRLTIKKVSRIFDLLFLDCMRLFLNTTKTLRGWSILGGYGLTVNIYYQKYDVSACMSFLIFMPAKQTINPIKKGNFVVPKICVTIVIITSNNATKQPDDVDQLVTQCSCGMLQTSPRSQIHTIETLIFRCFCGRCCYVII